MPLNFKAVIFDMDGTLIDSELHWIDAEKKFLSIFNLEWSLERTKKVNGTSLLESSRILKEDNNLPHPLDEILKYKIATSEEVYTCHSQPLPDAELIIKSMKERAKTAIASGASLDRIERIVDRFNWRKYFDALVSTDHVNFIGKPNPAIFLYAADTLGVSPEQCIVFEDSENGLRAAKSAGMKCVIRHDDRWSHGDFSDADLLVNSLNDSRVYNFLGL